MSLTIAGNYCLPPSGVVEYWSIVRVQQLQMLYRRSVCWCHNACFARSGT